VPPERNLLDRAFRAACEAAAEAGRIESHYFGHAQLQVEQKADESPVTIADREAEAAIRKILAHRTPEFGVVGEELGASGPVDHRWIVDPLDATANFVAGIPLFAVLIGLELDGRLELGVVHAPRWGSANGHSWWAVRGRGAWTGPGIPELVEEGSRLGVGDRGALAEARIAHGGLEVIQRSPLRPTFPALIDQVGRSRGFGDWWGHCLVAEGRVDAMVEGAVAYHDVAAIVPIIEEAGGVILTPPGAVLEPGYSQPFVSSSAALAPSLGSILFRAPE
jgi:histidinol-phosphatase